MLILSIDQSLSCSGWAMILDGTVTKYGKVETKLNSKDPSNRDRLQQIWNSFYEIIGPEGDHPDLIVLETFYGGSKHNGGNAIPEVRGVLKLLTSMVGVPLKEYAPQTVRKGMLGNGRAEKDQVAAFVSKELGKTFEKKDFDVTDAILMGLYASRVEDDEAAQRISATPVGLTRRKWPRSKGTKGDTNGK